MDRLIAGDEVPNFRTISDFRKLHLAELLAKAKSADEAEDTLHGSDRRGDELSEELARRQSRLARIQEPPGPGPKKRVVTPGMKRVVKPVKRRGNASQWTRPISRTNS